ncbi:MAG: enoyl-CoA hydratase/isomerase family protein [Sphingomonadales bacterium]|nr:enoyl-CoA hydratase/isomerase family protein [Sphingomonadales bacterium]
MRREQAGHLCTLVLSRPDKLNALDTQSFEELDAHLATIEAAGDAIGCVVLRAEGRGFCAGADLAALGLRADGTPVDPLFKPGVIDRLARLPQPVIAAVHGVCVTGGLELALACDFILADGSARFADTHGKWGLVGAWGMGQRLSRRIGTARAKRMMMTAAMVQAQAALALGLVDELAGPEGLDALVAGWAAAILANSSHTNIHAKRFLRETEGMPLDQALAHERAHYPGNAPDHAARLAAFGGKAERPSG